MNELETNFTSDEFLDIALKILEHEQYIIKDNDDWKLTPKGQIVFREVFHI